MKKITAITLSCIFFMGSTLVGLTIEPLRLFLEIEPGEQTAGKIALYNDKPYPVEVEVKLLPSQDSPVALDAWLKLNQGVFRIEPNHKTLLNYKVRLPPDATGEYYAKIRYVENAVKPDDGAIAVNLALTAPFFVTATGTEIRSLEVLNFSYPDESGSSFSVALHNSGNVHLIPQGDCTIFSQDTQELIHTVSLVSPNGAIYPEKTKTINFKTAQSLPPGNYLATFHFSMFEGKPKSIRKTFEFAVK